MVNNWFSLSTEDVLKELETTSTGLSDHQAKIRLNKYGQNELKETKTASLAEIFIRQFQSPLIYVLLAAALAVLFLKEYIDASIILFVLVFNAVVGAIQEGRSQNTLKALKELTQTNALVLRDGSEKIISDKLLVPGDIFIFQEGQKVPADARLLSESNLSVDESSLTGESVPVHKEARPLEDNLSHHILAEQHNILFRGTFIATGQGKAVVVATGEKTEIGKIARSVESINADLPLKKSVHKLTYQIILLVSLISLMVFVLGLVRGHGLVEMFTIVISLMVSAIPEGLPIVLTLVLATGVWRMSRKNALVKKLNAVEGLGRANIIAVDKTGTITQNKLAVTDFQIGDNIYTVATNGYEPEGKITLEDKTIILSKLPKELIYLSQIANINTSASLIQESEEDDWDITGDPTEAAILVLGQKLDSDLDRDSQNVTILQESPFTYTKKYRSCLYEIEERKTLSIIGAPENVMKQCQMTAREKAKIEENISKFSSLGQRVVAFAYQDNPTNHMIKHENNLKFGGLFSMSDTLNKNITQTVNRVNRAGLKVVMITGDHVQTAQAIAKKAGIFTPGDRVMTGQEIDVLTDNELSGHLDNVSVFARVTPEHKQKIVEAYQKRGDIIAMTGDGVNDAPSLVAADLGMAMGKNGTEVAKEAADIILLDDNFGSIVAAIEEGRNIYITLRKVITYLLSTSAGEIMIIAGSLLFGLPLPITAAQIIWLNLVTDGFLDVSLAMEPKDEKLLENSQINQSTNLINSSMLIRIGLFAIVMTIGTLYLLSGQNPADKIRFGSIALTIMAAFQWYNAWNSKSDTQSVFTRNILNNKYLILGTLSVVGLQAISLYLPFTQKILGLEPLSLTDWLLILAIASSALWVEEIRKMFARRTKV